MNDIAETLDQTTFEDSDEIATVEIFEADECEESAEFTQAAPVSTAAEIKDTEPTEPAQEVSIASIADEAAEVNSPIEANEEEPEAITAAPQNLRLKKIKLAGFKSFADPTVLELKSNLTSIVGPNGCGKSNVLDAIRAVIGESSAKQLRGEHMTDAIFNGTTNRKPVGQASVELLFDNSEGGLGGQYASYAEISIRREILRDGQSNYYLNGVRCRRKDIIGIFLGTGLGPRSYAIIEQGMISNLIEAKPEELRVYIEEVAGVSKYKERRRETENRIRHTQENLERLTDIRQELEKQMNHLQRQANAAERYKVLKEEQRLLQAQAQSLHWRELTAQLSQREVAIGEAETQVEAKIAEQRSADLGLEQLREVRIERTDTFNEVQAAYYRLGADIARIEQTIKNLQNREEQLTQDLEELTAQKEELEQNLTDDQAKQAELEQSLARLEPQFETVKMQATESAEQLAQAQDAMHAWQHEWDEFNSSAAKTAQQAEVEQTRLHHLQQQMEQAKQRVIRLQIEREQLHAAVNTAEIETLAEQSDAVSNEYEQYQQRLTELNQQIQSGREQVRALTQQLDTELHQLRTLQGQHTSLIAQQSTALGKNEENVTRWLSDKQWLNQPRLAEKIQVENGWEKAVEVVLSPYLQAVCIDNIAQAIADLANFNGGKLTLLAKQAVLPPNTTIGTTLASKVKSDWALEHLLAGIYVADSVTEALHLSESLSTHESVITPDGIWLSKAWVQVNRTEDEKTGVLAREQTLRKLNNQLDEQQAKVAEHEAILEAAKEQLHDWENARNEQEQQFQRIAAQHSEIRAQLKAKQAQHEQLQQREQAIAQELIDVDRQMHELQEKIVTAETNHAQAISTIETDKHQREQFLQQREQLRAQLDQVRAQANEQKQQADELQIRIQSSRHELHFTQQNVERLQQQLATFQQRCENIEQGIAETQAPLQEQKAELEEWLAKRLELEQQLNIARDSLQQVEHQVREIEQQRGQIEQQVQTLRSHLEKLRLDSQTLQVKRDGYEEQITQSGYELKAVLEALPEDAELNAWQERLARIENSIQRMGAINLAAIDEFAQINERKTYLDAQNEDLLKALEILQEAIQKIDKETRQRFKDTFEKVNAGFNQLFPQIFGGGKAYLELVGEDILDTGVLIKAQPPGKKNATIHLLSGGEKALTAIALVFSLFRLTPAPFCFLDEVDAPLDDLNVGRFCNLVKEMSKTVQFIFISHNKIAIEMAEQLMGVTMHEPGVSRLVSVDLDAAIEMAKA